MADNKTVPVPVQLAVEALKILTAEDAALAEQARKKLPGFALRLAAAGEEVTIERLIASARAGEIDKVEAPKQKTKTYAEIVAQIRENKAKERKGEASVITVVKAIEAGDIDTVKRLAVKFSKQQVGDLRFITEAARYGRLDIVKFFVEDCGMDIHDGSLYRGEILAVTAGEGHLDTVKYLVKKGADVHEENELALRNAAALGQLNVVKYLVEECDARAGIGAFLLTGDTFTCAATHGRLDVLRYLLEKHPINAVALLQKAAAAGHLNVVKYLVEERGMDIHANHELVLQHAMATGQMAVGNYLINEAGANVSALPPSFQEAMQDFNVMRMNWKKIAHIEPPFWLVTEDPLFYRPVTCKALQNMLSQELQDNENREYIISILTFHAAGLFGTEDRVLQYFEKWGKDSKKPLHDTLSHIFLPQKKTREMDVKAWGDAVLKCGPSMAKLVKFADNLPVPEKSDDGRTWSMVNTREKAAKFAYKDAAQNPALAAVCMEHDVNEGVFNIALELSKNPPAVKNIPDITIDGDKFDMPGATFHRLAADDIRGLFLGEMTDCCQSIGGLGAECAEQGFKSKDSGFYVVENAKGRVVGQTWAWRGQKGELVFDSIETLGENVKPEQWQKLTKVFARTLAEKPADVTALLVGKGGATPKTLSRAFNKAATPAIPLGYNGKRDSQEQVVVWKKMAALNA